MCFQALRRLLQPLCRCDSLHSKLVVAQGGLSWGSQGVIAFRVAPTYLAAWLPRERHCQRSRQLRIVDCECTTRHARSG